MGVGLRVALMTSVGGCPRTLGTACLFLCIAVVNYLQQQGHINAKNSLDDNLSIPSPPIIWEESEKSVPKFNQHNDLLRKEFHDKKK